MINVAGVRFRNTGKSYYFDPQELTLQRGMHVIVETENGKGYGTVTIPPILVQDDKVVQPLRPILRIATEEDEEINEENRRRSIEAGKICMEKIEKHGLEMKLVETEYAFDRSKLMFYFTADGRVDFRELVKELASVFRTRIELRQIGVRDEAKIKGGMGMCGRELCCTTFLSDFAPVSIRMAKEQNLSLNPTKISGTCGRLMCCLKNEQETYEYLKKKLPKNGQSVETIDEQTGTVQSVNILKQTVKVVLEINGEKEIREYAAGELAYGDKGFECEPRKSREDDLDYFSEQLKKAVAAAQETQGEHHPKEERDRKRGKNRNSNKNRQGDRKQSGEQKQQSEEHKDPGRRRQSETARQKPKNARQGSEKKQGGEQKQGSEKKRQNGQNSQNRKPNSRRSGSGKKNNEKETGAAQNAGQQHVQTNPNPEGQKDVQKGAQKSGRSRNNRYRGHRNREGKLSERDRAETKQSDS